MEEAVGDDQVADVAQCPGCSDLTEHEVLSRTVKGAGEDLLVRCVSCSNVHRISLRPPSSTSVRATLSDGADSFSALIESDADEEISKGDLFQFDDAHWQVTRIEIGDKMPVNSSEADKITSMWAIRKDACVVRLTLTDGEVSTPSSIECDPEKVFSCGTVMVLDGKKWRIRAIHTGAGRTLRGKRVAAEVRRMYLHSI
ncbi:MAG: HVO_0476 family zinc finger protein [Candidatus Thermoplasmatota archaeon]|jgi:uncharacterized Zn finger protein|nr:HVO_0476 family zinc finger protein [Candidatus Thermoplasmatota archaeon]MED5274356.1 HVO_0476 family zinc finger protein [Candidatus Thermoplasmatota archaeon]